MRKWALVLAALTIVCALGWAYYAQQKREEAELQLGLDSTRVLSEAFRTTNQLKVSDIEGWILATSTDKGLIEILDASQTVKAPYSVDYFIDMSKVGQSDFFWNSSTKTLLIEIPDPLIAQPNIDMSRAQVRQGGVWISREAGVRLQRKAASAITGKAAKTANSPENLKMARAAALEAVRRNVQAPLNTAHLSEVRVDVRFKSQRNTNDDVWDYTLPYEQVTERLEQMRK
jgi:Protein of unknown function (DUF4230)